MLKIKKILLNEDLPAFLGEIIIIIIRSTVLLARHTCYLSHVVLVMAQKIANVNRGRWSSIVFPL